MTNDWGYIQTLATTLNQNQPTVVNLAEILVHLNIKCRFLSLGTDVKGNPILGASSIDSSARKIIINNIQGGDYEHLSTRGRFTLAHEIGHIQLQHGDIQCTEIAMNQWTSRGEVESQANYFASALLLPTAAMKLVLNSSDLSLGIVKIISQRFLASIQAVAIRLIKMVSGSYVLIKHNGVSIDWVISSCEYDYSVPNCIDQDSLACALTESRPRRRGKVDPCIWIGQPTDDIVCIEDSEKYEGFILTILNIYNE